MKYYTQEELTEAIDIAVQVITDRTESCAEFTYGTNCCAPLLPAYDESLRGSSSSAELDFQWSGVKDFVVKLKRHGVTVKEYLEYRGYEIIKNKRPLLGGAAFAGGSMVAGPRSWISTSDKNEGIVHCKKIMFLELNIDTIARPKRNNK